MKSYRLCDLSEARIADLCYRNPGSDPSLMRTCQEIFQRVESQGDEAIREYTQRFDGVDLSQFRVSAQELSDATAKVPVRSREALEHAARNIRKFHAAQQVDEKPVQVESGVCCWRENRAIDSVGLYIPGGNAVFPSTVLMLGIPAQLAGCRRVALCVPPRQDCSVAAEVLVAARIAGIEEIFKIGGAQAIAALAIGTETVASVDKILGPGNRWVQAAKLLAILRGVAIDMVAGPTEVLVVADDSARFEWVACDLVSQAEHGVDSRAILVTTSERLLEQVARLVWQLIEDLPLRDLAERSLKESFSLLADSLDGALAFANQYAPEHLILQVKKPEQWTDRVRHAGSVFLGSWSPEVAGDYASGTNHTLPTSGLAKAYSGVSVDTFVKRITFQEITPQGLQGLAPTLETLAEMEGLEGHRRAVQIRRDSQLQRPTAKGS